MRLAPQLERPRLQARHLQQVLHEPVQAIGLLAHRLEQLVARRSVEPAPLVEDRADGARDRGQRRAQVVGHRAEEGVAQALRLDPDLSLLGFLGEPRALQRQRGLGGERLELM